MAREKGTFNFAANFELLKKGPLDAKSLVGTYADLTNSATWEDNEGLIWLYDGAVVSTGNETDPSKRGVYFLNDADNYMSGSSWVKLLTSTSPNISNIENIGSGIGVFSGITGYTAYLRSIAGSGITNTTLSGDSIVISTVLNDNVLEYSSDEGTFKPYNAYTSGITFYTGSTKRPDNIDFLNVNAILTATALRVSTGVTALTGYTFSAGDLYWDEINRTISLQHTGNVKQQIGQELYVRGKNTGTTTISNGTIVYISGSDDNETTIKPARASESDGDTVVEVIGLATEDISSGNVGFITTLGIVGGLNTSGYTSGEAVYLSTNAFGEFTTTKPSYPDYIIEVGIITKIDDIDGRILVKVSNLSQTRSKRGIETVNAPFTATTTSDVLFVIGAGTYYLPPNPLKGQEITFIDNDGDAETNNIIIDGNGSNINGGTQAIINSNYGSMTLIYNGTNWYATTITP